MGMEHLVAVKEPSNPWPRSASILAERGMPVQLRMIDGQLAFPDESPSDDWRELRVGTPAGMITLARRPTGIAIVTWGNADTALTQAWNMLAWAVAVAGGGEVVSESERLSPDAFAASAGLASSVS